MIKVNLVVKIRILPEPPMQLPQLPLTQPGVRLSDLALMRLLNQSE